MIKPSEVRWMLASLVLIALLLAAVNVPFAMTKIRSRTSPRPSTNHWYEGGMPRFGGGRQRLHTNRSGLPLTTRMNILSLGIVSIMLLRHDLQVRTRTGSQWNCNCWVGHYLL